jgi:DNA (cytosine-5)-methyltransferase 1
MRYLSVCSGIEAATVAWHDLGWQTAAFSEIEPFPSAVLKHHYPDVPNVGDMTKYKEWDIGTIDLLVGGTPCQSFSVAGLRKGLEDPRGNLALVYCGILDRFKPKWFVWENVPGVLSSSGGRDFGSFLGAVAELGYGFAYRVLDAQYFGVAQRRRRVFVVGCLGDWRSAAEVLFERESLRGDLAPSRKKGQEVAGTIAARFGISRNNHEECVAQTLQARVGQGGFDLETETPIIMSTLCASDATKWGSNQWVDEGKAVLHSIALAENTIGRQPHNGGNGDGFTVGGPMYTLNATGVHGVNQSMAVRRLTPVECERLQGFPDNYTNITWRKQPESPDGPRYKALGNSMAVPVMAWIGRRIANVA